GANLRGAKLTRAYLGSASLESANLSAKQEEDACCSDCG
ncbi:MAG TPA: pentapeptide repeat-containing protein, partial [Candidatus Handelsmanbacteria bacterium]|nr:pentapeptide repeat-containing protein [Candidatus Handelsmanbacteria bacterium]